MTEKEYQALHRKQMYDQIQRLRNEEHLSIQRIADRLGINFRTVKRYLEMSRSEFESFSDNITNKPQILTPYTDFVVERLSLYQDTSTAQMHDWLKEAYPDFPKVTQRTVNIVPNPFPESPGVLRKDGGIGVEWWGPDGIGNGGVGLRGRAGGGRRVFCGG